MLRGLAYRCLNAWHRQQLRPYSQNLRIHPSSRLLRRFDVKFLVSPEPREYLTIGQRCTLNGHFIFEARSGTVSIGDRCYIGNETSVICRRAITIGNDVTIAWGVTLYDHDSHSKDWRDRADVVRHFYDHYGTPRCYEELEWRNVASAPIRIEDRAWLGFDVVVLKGVVIGEGAIVGARSVVVRDVAPYTIVAGNPARMIGQIDPQQGASLKT